MVLVVVPWLQRPRERPFWLVPVALSEGGKMPLIVSVWLWGLGVKTLAKYMLEYPIHMQPGPGFVFLIFKVTLGLYYISTKIPSWSPVPEPQSLSSKNPQQRVMLAARALDWKGDFMGVEADWKNIPGQGYSR